MSTLLALLDGIGSGSDSVSNSGGGGGGGGGGGEGGGGGDTASRVVVLAATNRPHALEPALRRPGRLDREIDIGVPDEAGRYEILTVQLKRLQTYAVHVSVDEPTQRHCASVTHGFVGADLQLVCTEALLGAMRQNITDATAAEEKGDGGGGEGLGTDAAGGRAAVDGTVVVGNADLVGAISRVSPSALREVAVEVPKVRWADVGGQAEVKQAMKELVEWPLTRPEAFAKLGIKPPSGLLLYGPPGCSKTLMARALATETNMNFLAVQGPELLSKWLGESERALQTLFRYQRRIDNPPPFCSSFALLLKSKITCVLYNFILFSMFVIKI